MKRSLIIILCGSLFVCLFTACDNVDKVSQNDTITVEITDIDNEPEKDIYTTKVTVENDLDTNVVAESETMEDISENAAYTVSKLFGSEERLWFSTRNEFDKEHYIEDIFLIRPDGTLKYSKTLWSEHVLVNYIPPCNFCDKHLSLGEASKMSDDEIVAYLDGYLTQCLAYPFEYRDRIRMISWGDFSGRTFEDDIKKFKEYVANNNLKYWFSIFTDSTGNNFESEYFIYESYPEVVNYTDDLTEYGVKLEKFKIDEIVTGEIYDSRYIGFRDRDKGRIIATRLKENESFDLIYDELGTDGVLIDSIGPGENEYVRLIDYQKTSEEIEQQGKYYTNLYRQDLIEYYKDPIAFYEKEGLQ